MQRTRFDNDLEYSHAAVRSCLIAPLTISWLSISVDRPGRHLLVQRHDADDVVELVKHIGMILRQVPENG